MVVKGHAGLVKEDRLPRDVQILLCNPHNIHNHLHFQTGLYIVTLLTPTSALLPGVKPNDNCIM